MDDKLYMIVDYILNQAEDRDVDVILKAIKKRYDDREGSGAMGLKPGQMARETASQISSQVGFSRDMVRDTVKNMARDIIIKNAPELSSDQVDELLDTWVPDPEQAAAAARNQALLPRDVLITMVDQFMRYSQDLMTATEIMELENQIPGWATKYWEKFPPELRQILALYLKGKMQEAEFQPALKTIMDGLPD
ncbi:MAG: hypothetical protein JEY99_09980 [Spirochaetales bacterium]|nr:hypothetical protein [Spirochaetales bacterium]